MHRYLCYLSRDASQAEDLTQEVFYKALTSLHRVKDSKKVKSWLFSIARNTFYDFLRKKKKEPQCVEEEVLQNFISSQFIPEEYVLQQEKAIQLQKIFQDISSMERDIILLRVIQGYDYTEIAQIYDKTAEYVKLKFFRTRMKIIKRLKEGDEI